MPKIFKLPELGESIKTIQVVKVLVAVGDVVAMDQPLVELETDKATVEVPSSVSGKVTAIHVQAGTEISVGAPLLTVEGDAAGEAAPAPAPVAAAPSAPAAAKPMEQPAVAVVPAAPARAPGPSVRAEFAVPELGENIKTIQVVRVFVKDGQLLAKDQPVLELETDKATVEVPSTVSGVVREVRVKEGDELTVGAVVFSYDSEAYAPEEPPAPATPAAVPASSPASAARLVASAPASGPAPRVTAMPAGPGRRVPAAPSVRRFAREIGIDISQVPGSSGHGRVSTEDVKRFAKALNEGRAALPAAAAAPVMSGMAVPALPDFAKWGTVAREKMSVIRRKTAEHMALSWSQIPHVTLFDHADITDLDDLRKRYAPRAEQAGGKLTMAVMVIKVLAQALKVFPKFNASIDMATREVIFKKYCNIGVAVDTERGLMVPVLRDVDKLNMIQISVALGQLAEKARTGKVTVADLEGGTFTITNLGRTCGLFFTPIINYPEVAILGVGRAYDELDPGTGKARKKLPLSLSFDHRLIDGAEGVKFLGWIIEALGEPLVLSLEG
ncbi:MAG: 2-oxo acid dehydrogenase subunit E2 [Lentisphaerae bacterium]|nr:2-oxo acid dehydrogenase subunit E2 [Lentisphaerota bacterium]